MQFAPTFLLKNKHIQTVYATFFRKPISLALISEIVELDDGDFVDCYWLDKPDEESQTPIVVLFHGLEGSSKSPYIQGAMQTLNKNGYACVLMHFRGCSGLDNRLPRSYHGGDTECAKAFITHLEKAFPQAPLFAIGYSLGANMLLKLLGEYGKEYRQKDDQCGVASSVKGLPSPIKAAIAVSAPMQLDDSANAITKGFSRIYESRLLSTLKRTVLKKYQQHNMDALLGKTAEQIEAINSIREFDDIYTAKINGFDGVQDFYSKNSAKQFLPYITTTTLVIHALDDPFMTPAVLPEQGIDNISPAIELEIHQNGGHVGFVMGSVFNPIYYLEHRILAYFDEQKRPLKYKKKAKNT